MRASRGTAKAEMTPAERRYWLFAVVAMVVTIVTTAGAMVIILQFALTGDRPPMAAIIVSQVMGFGCAIAGGLVVLLHRKYRDPAQERAIAGLTKRTPVAFASVIGVWMSLYLLAVANLSWLIDVSAWPLWARIAAAIAPALPIGGVIYALLRYLKREADEYQRLLLTRTVLISTGLTFFVLTAWGFLELYVGVPHFPLSLAMAPFWIFFVLSNWWVRRRA